MSKTQEIINKILSLEGELLELSGQQPTTIPGTIGLVSDSSFIAGLFYGAKKYVEGLQVDQPQPGSVSA